MSNILSKYNLGISYNGTKFAIGLYTNTLYFRCPLCIGFKIEGQVYYAPLFFDQMYSDIENTPNIRFYLWEAPYYIFLKRQLSAEGAFALSSDTLTIAYSVNAAQQRLRYAFTYSIGDMQRQCVTTKVHIKVIARSGESSFIDDEFSLEYTSGTEYFLTGIRKDRKVFDSDTDGFKDYDSYTECGEEYQGDPIFPDSETIRITYDGVDGYYDVTLTNKGAGKQGTIHVNIPVQQGGSWELA